LSLLQISALSFHVFNLPEAKVLYKDNGLCFGLIRSLIHLKGHVSKEQQNLLFLNYMDGELWESKSIKAISGNICLKEQG